MTVRLWRGRRMLRRRSPLAGGQAIRCELVLQEQIWECAMQTNPINYPCIQYWRGTGNCR